MSLFSTTTHRHLVVVDFDESNESEVVTLGGVIWDSLDLGQDAATIALSPTTAVKERRRPKSVIFWAKRSSDTDCVTVPGKLKADCDHLFQTLHGSSNNPQCFVSPISAAPLDEIVLVALSLSAYSLAETNRERIVEHLSQEWRILRCNSILSINPSTAMGNGHDITRPLQHQYEIILTEPVHQGVFDAIKTNIIIVNRTQNDDGATLGSPTSSQSVATSDDEQSDIDESFLLHTLSQHPNRGARYSEEDLAEQEHSTPFRIVPIPVRTLIQQDGGFPDVTVLVRSADLARLSIFSGDWVVLLNPQDRSKARLAKIFGTSIDELVLENGDLLAPPMLIANISSPNHQTASQLEVSRSYFGQDEPPIPTARSITLARITSPVSEQRRHQLLIIQALKQYFKDAPRILKKGDILALPVSLANASLLEGVIEEESKRSQPSDELLNRLPILSSTPDEVVHFRVVNIEHPVVQIKNDIKPDHHFAALMGELGCWMDPKVTKLTQVGTENSFVPHLSHYFNLASNGVLLTLRARKSVLCGEDSPFSQLREILAAAIHPAAEGYKLSLSVLLKGPRGVGKRTIARWAAEEVGLHIQEVDCYDVVDETDVKTEGILRARFEQAENCAPSILLLRNIDALARNTQRLESGKEPAIATALQESIANLQDARSKNGYPTILVATTRDASVVPLNVIACFKHEITFEAPDEDQRLAVLENLLEGVSLNLDVDLTSIATQTAALVAGDLSDLIARVQRIAAGRLAAVSERLGISVTDLELSGFSLEGADFEQGLNEARSAFSASIGAPSIPKVTWDDVGGLESVKSDILDTIQLPLEHPELFAEGMKKRSGILFFGPPGTGKTLLAKAVATSFSLNFLSIKGPELLNMYIGESEANVRRVFQRARDARPCVIFFDELDSVAPKRGNHGDSGGVMDRIVSQLLAELDGMSDGTGADVFVIGATNRPDLLDPALLRPGRFDKLLYLGVSDTHEAQLRILEALTRKFRLDPQLELVEIAEQCPFNYTGADFYALCSDAMLKAMLRRASEIDRKIEAINSEPHLPGHVYPITPQYYLSEMATELESEIEVSRQDFLSALKELVPSVSQTEMEHYRQVQKKFAEGAHKDEESSTMPNRLVEEEGGDGENMVLGPITKDRKERVE